MSSAPQTDEAPPVAPAPPPAPVPAPAAARLPRSVRPALRDAGVCLLITLVAALLTHGLWPDPTRRGLALNPDGQALDEWFLAYATRAYRGDFSLVTALLNAPEGVNLLANASLIGLGLIMAPVTLAFGAPYSFALLTGVNLAATGTGWYLLLARTLQRHRLAAALGGGFTAFAPGMIAQSNGHLHMTAGWLVPPMVWCGIRLVRSGRVLGPGLLLGALITAQFFVGEEVLFLTAATAALFCLAYGLVDRSAARRALPTLLPGMAVAAALSTALLAVPLWLQFSGPQSVHDRAFPAGYSSADLFSFAGIAPLSLAGGHSATRLVSGPAEYTAFFGAPLLLIVAGATLWLWRRPEVLAGGLVSALLCLLALGPRIFIAGHDTGRWAPFALLQDLPMVSSTLPARFALAAIPLLALILATVVHVAITRTESLRLLVPVAVVAALIPLAPAALPVTQRTAPPRFISEGYWRGFVPRDGVLVPVPLPDGTDPQAMRWAAATDVAFATPQGWFIGPSENGGSGAVGSRPRPTALLLSRVARSGVPAQLSDGDRAQAARDIDFWHASCFVLAAARPNAGALKQTLDGLLGPGEHVSDAWVWRTHIP